MPAQDQTDKSRYPSKYSPGNFITAAQFITEMICEHRANVQKKPLMNQFWRLPEWASFYKQQILAATGLLKIYSPNAIIAALRRKEAARIFSLRAPHLDAIIDAEERRIKLENEQRIKKVEIVNKEIVPELRPEVGKKSVAAKLRALDE